MLVGLPGLEGKEEKEGGGIMRDIISVGEVLIDLTQTGTTDQGIPAFAANPGGAPANVAVAAARLGAETAFFGKVGRDSFGAYLRRVLEENGVDCSGLRTAASPPPWLWCR